MQDFRKLLVWQKGHALTLEVYRFTQTFPRDEMYGLTSQIRRSAASVPTNIAEVAGRKSQAEFNRFLTIAYGSASELDYQIFLARELSYLSQPLYETCDTQVKEVRRMPYKLIQKTETTRL